MCFDILDDETAPALGVYYKIPQKLSRAQNITPSRAAVAASTLPRIESRNYPFTQPPVKMQHLASFATARSRHTAS
jgi:hypothetical protein